MKVKCNECGKIFDKELLLIAENPFNKNETITGCKYCFAVDNYSVVCDEPDCKEIATCGFPTKNNYRNTCSKHCQI